MTIPYYENFAGIQEHESETECTCHLRYVVLDKNKVDVINKDVWETFESIRVLCEEELKQFLSIIEVIRALSPEGDETYVVNFLINPIEDPGGLLQ